MKVKVIYICEYDEYKAYEVGLKPGEYTFQEFIGRIKEKVQLDRALVKVCKRMFVLVDLIGEGTVFGQMFTNEQMKFNFKAEQTLTTYAYEISRSHRERVRPMHYIHIAKTEIDSRISYHSFPILVNFQESEILKNISIKIFRALRMTLAKTIFAQDPLFLSLGENECFTYVFSGAHPFRNYFADPYDLVIVLKDGSRWKLDC